MNPGRSNDQGQPTLRKDDSSTAGGVSDLWSQQEFALEIRAQARANAFAPVIDAHFSALSWNTRWVSGDLVKPKAGQAGGVLFLLDVQHGEQDLGRLIPTLKRLHPLAAIVVLDDDASQQRITDHIRAGADDVISADAQEAMELALVRVTQSLERLATARLREAQTQLFHAAIEQSPVSVVITDADANIRYVNPAFSQSTGYSRDEALGQNPRLLKSGELTSESYQSFWDTLSAGQSWAGEFHNKRKDGILVLERAHVAPVRNDIGLITHYLAVKEDITASKANAQALREATNALRATQTFALMANWAYDTQARRIVSHHGLEGLVGIAERGAIALERLLERFAGEDRLALHQKIEKAAAEGVELSATVRSCSSPERWFTIRGQPAIDPVSGARQLHGFFAGHYPTRAHATGARSERRTLPATVSRQPIRHVADRPEQRPNRRCQHGRFAALRLCANRPDWRGRL